MDTGKAVFLSYASQDAEAVRRLAEALRAEGVEVWFDQSELKGGDTWDQKIRRQIKECALFVPVISASTQSRPEGYFRLEWKLAVDRSHLLADDHPFIFPVVIDETTESAARVPERFRDFQWSRLGRNHAPTILARRVAGLIAGEQVPEPAAARDESKAAKRRRRPKERGWASHVFRFGGVIIALGYLSRPLWSPPRGETPPPAAAATSEVDRLAARAIADYYTVGYTRQELAAAEADAQQAVQQNRRSAAAWSALAGVHATYLQRNWDRSQKRQQDIQDAVNQALNLDPRSTEALFARGQLLLRGGRLLAGTEGCFRQALDLAPANNRYRRALADTLGALGQRDEQQAQLEEAVRRDPNDPIVRYDFAQWLIGADVRDSNPVSPENYAAALGQIDAGLATKKLNSLLLLRARIQAGNGDLAAMRSSLDELAKLPLSEREEDRAVFTAMWGALLEHDPAKAITAAALTTKNYFEDAVSVRSKEALLALAHQQAGRPNQAQLAWKQAENTIRARLTNDSNNTILTSDLAKTLAWQGRTEEAKRLFAPIEAAMLEAGTSSQSAAQFYAALGDAGQAVAWLHKVLYRFPETTPSVLKVDPTWDKLRGQAEFDTFLAEAIAAEKAKKSIP